MMKIKEQTPNSFVEAQIKWLIKSFLVAMLEPIADNQPALLSSIVFNFHLYSNYCLFVFSKMTINQNQFIIRLNLTQRVAGDFAVQYASIVVVFLD